MSNNNPKKENGELLEKIVSLCKRRGFIYQGSEIYGGLAGFWDYGPLGVLLKNNLCRSWWRKFVSSRDDMYGLDAAIVMNSKVWEASGHIEGFADPMVECKKCILRFRADKEGIVHPESPGAKRRESPGVDSGKCRQCGGTLSEPKKFNMMFKTKVGAVEDESAVTYLRPETAQGIFVNFKNVVDSFHPKLPFGIAQIGKAFRNEITPRDFLFRIREFEQMEIEYFVPPPETQTGTDRTRTATDSPQLSASSQHWSAYFEYWKDEMIEWIEEIGLDMNRVHDVEIPKKDLAHYSKRTVDFEFEYPFGQKELYGLAYRTDFDLKNHAKESGEKLEYLDPDTRERFVPHVIEPSFGMERTILALLLSTYSEDELGEGKRIFLKLKPDVAPYKVAVFPLLRNKPKLVEKARIVYGKVRAEIPETLWDDNGNIGKRYRRQDEIGTPFTITIDFDTLEDDTVTVRDRDTAKQVRVKTNELVDHIQENIKT